MSSLENNRSQDPRPVGAFTNLAHSLNELNVPGANQAQVERLHVLRCDAFRVEYTTGLRGTEEVVKSVAIVPTGPTGFEEGVYRLSPEPNATVLERVNEKIQKALKTGGIGVLLLKDLLELESELPNYTWKPSQGLQASEQSEIDVATPVLPEFKYFVAHPKWLPHYGMKSTQSPETHWVSAVIQEDSILCVFRTTTDWSEEQQPVQSVRLRYSGPTLTPDDKPSVIGERVTQGLKAIMQRARDEGALTTHDALISNEFKAPFLEPIAEPTNPLRESLRRPILQPRHQTLASGATTHLVIDQEQGLAQVQVRANSGSGASSMVFQMPATSSPDREKWVSDISEAYRQLSSPGESPRLSGLYALRNLSAKIEHKGVDVQGLLGKEELQRLVAMGGEFNFIMGFATGPGISIANMQALCDGVQQVGFFLAKEPRMSGLYNDLSLGFAPDGSLHFSAKNDLGGAFEGFLHKSMLTAVGDRAKAALILVDAFGRQQHLRERRSFEQVAHLLADRDKDGHSYILTEGHSSFCAMPPQQDTAAQRAYTIANSILKGFSNLAGIPVRVSANYLAPGTCEMLLGYPGAPFDMSCVIKEDTLTSVSFCPSLPLHADSVRRVPPVVTVATKEPLLSEMKGVEAVGSLVVKYLDYAKESLDPRSAKPLSESAVYRTAQSMATPPSPSEPIRGDEELGGGRF